MEALHPTQTGILNQLLFAKTLRFTDLKIDPEIENNTFQFHLNKVIELGYVEKTALGYSLTEEGKILANYIDIPKNKFTVNRKSSVRLYCMRDRSDDQKNKIAREVLIKTRFKHPFFGLQGFPTGKILAGEYFVDAAKRVAQSELALSGNPQLIRVAHYMVKSERTGKLLDDNIFFDFYINNPAGELSFSTASHFEWVPLSNFEKHMVNPIDDIEDHFTAFELLANFKGEIKFLEREHVVGNF